MHRIPLVLLVLGLATGCLGGAGSLTPCDSNAADSSICSLTNPEDIGFSPARDWIIVSEMGPNESNGESEDAMTRRGRLTAIRIADLGRRLLYPLDQASKLTGSREGDWGDVNCPGEPDSAKFGPHGIDVGVRMTGETVIAVVNHGGREAIELFEWVDRDGPALVWRGCVPMIPGRSANDVALMPGDGFVVTNFMPAFEGVSMKAIWTLVKMSFGGRTGSVLRWQPGMGFEEIENSGGSAPNGVSASADGSQIFVAEWGGESIYRLRLSEDGPAQRDEIRVEQNPDNLTWMRDGRLLVAGQHGGISAALGCASVQNAGCDIGYSVYVIDPEPLTATRLFEGRGAASVALEVADEVFVGFFVGDQIERVSISD